MKKQHEMLLVATLAGLVIVGAATFAIQPALAAGHGADAKVQVIESADWSQLDTGTWAPVPGPDAQPGSEFAS